MCVKNLKVTGNDRLPREKNALKINQKIQEMVKFYRGSYSPSFR